MQRQAIEAAIEYFEHVNRHLGAMRTKADILFGTATVAKRQQARNELNKVRETLDHLSAESLWREGSGRGE